VDWACLGVGAAWVLLTAAALRPFRGKVGSGISFFPSWLASEAPLHFAAVAVIAVAVLGAFGSLTRWPGWGGLVLVACSVAALACEFGSGLRSRTAFEAALDGAGVSGSPWPWSARDTGRVVTIVPRRPRGVERIRNVSYSSDPAHVRRLDIYRNKACEGGAPVLVYFHGGGWIIGDKREQGLPMMGHLAERGYVCVTANYSLSPRATWPAHVLDCKLALAWVKRHIAEFGGDPSSVFVAGGSAGGHLASLVALSAGDATWQPGYEDEDLSVAGCIGLYGVYDLVDAERTGHPGLVPILEKRVFKQHRDSDAFRAASPIARISVAAPAFFVVHGRNDVLVPVASARVFVAALRAACDRTVAYAELPLAQHAFDVFWSPRTVHLAHAVERFTGAVLAENDAERSTKQP
jgi:acetyl esterase/lipase